MNINLVKAMTSSRKLEEKVKFLLNQNTNEIHFNNQSILDFIYVLFFNYINPKISYKLYLYVYNYICI